MGINNNVNDFQNMEINPEDEKVINAYLNALDHEVPDVWDAVNRKLDALPDNKIVPIKKKRFKMSYIYTAMSAAAILFIAILSINIMGDPRHAKSKDAVSKYDEATTSAAAEFFVEETTQAAIPSDTVAGAESKDVTNGVEFDAEAAEEVTDSAEANILITATVTKLLPDNRYLISIDSIEPNAYNIEKGSSITITGKNIKLAEGDLIKGYIAEELYDADGTVFYSFTPYK